MGAAPPDYGDWGMLALLREDPPVIYCWENLDWFLHLARDPQRPLVVGMHLSCGWRPHLIAMRNFLADALLEYPGLRLVLGVDTNEQRMLLDPVPTILAGHNGLLDADLFTIQDLGKSFPAIYAARAVAYKRIELAQKVHGRVLWLTSGDDLPHKDILQVCPNLWSPQLDDRANYNFLPREEVVSWYNRAVCGLCLSASEGAMFAAVEYQLCGLPVVNTPSTQTTASGTGREVWFEPEHVLHVNANPDDVAQAVAWWERTRDRPTAEEIRSAMLTKVLARRSAFLHAVEDAAGLCGPPLRIPFVHKLGRHYHRDRFHLDFPTLAKPD